MNVNDPVMRVLAWIVAIAVAVQLTFELFCQLLPYLAPVALILIVLRVVTWYRQRW